MNPEEVKHIFFLGIGGIGMSALARYFRHHGKVVSGYDKVAGKLTKKLEDEGIRVFYTADENELPDNIDLVVYTPAVPADLPLFSSLKNRNIRMVKRAQILGEISKNYRVIAVAGTHGKTTTAAILAHVLHASGVDCTAFVGGIMAGYESNCMFGSSEWMVAEADEYDRSFLTLNPAITIINAIDPDHLDIYSSHDYMKEAYKTFASQTLEHLIIPLELRTAFEALSGKLFTIGSGGSNLEMSKYQIENNNTHFTVKDGGDEFDFTWSFPGMHNAMNALAAIAAARMVGLDYSVIRNAIGSFRGIRRRFERLLQTNSYVIINDYAHHPAELQAVITATKELYSGKHITGIFQPHLYSRTRDFAEGFAEALDGLHTCYVMEIYPAREKPIDGVDSLLILNQMYLKDRHLLGKSEATSVVEKIKRGVLLILGAGDIDDYSDLWCEQLKSKAA